jgi:GT2 family glycosyltransferase
MNHMATTPAPGAVWRGPGEATMLQGWVMPEAEAAEIGIEIEGQGVSIVVADGLAMPGDGLPEGARLFTWHLPAKLGGTLHLRAWNLDTGTELAGSPLRLDLPPPAEPPAAGAPLSLWPEGLAGHAGTSAPFGIANGLWIAAAPPVRSLRYEMTTLGEASATRAGARGVRLLADAVSPRIEAHFEQSGTPPAPGIKAGITLRAWLPEATQPNLQAQCEIWLTRREGGTFRPLRRLRRSRIFRRPSEVSAELILTEEEAAAGPFWLTVAVLGARGLSCLPPAIDQTAHHGPARMEDARLEASFGALAELIRLHGEAGATAHPLLPPTALPAAPFPAVKAEAATAGHPFTQIVLPVYNGDAVVRDCLRSLRANDDSAFQVLVVDDGSRGFTAEMLRDEVAGDPRFLLHRRDTNRGYTKSINEGVMLTTAPWVVVLNSDVLVPAGWLDRLHAAVRARPGTGMAGPLSNAATWQSIPDVKRADMGWATNDSIEPRHLARVQAMLAGVSQRDYPEFPVLNGFCTLIAREVFDRVGLYDEDAFPMGYGEETDLCLRARRAGFRLTLADDCFVYHHKSISFGAAGRSPLTRAGGLEMTNKHLGANIAALERQMQTCKPLLRLRALMTDLVAELD